MLQLNIPSSLQKIEYPLMDSSIELYVKRDDLIHPDISGNKWRKLNLNILQAEREHKNVILTFGGAYSNHIRATAAAANMLGLKSIGIIRGEELNKNSNENLRFAAQNGMELHFLDRETYFLRNHTDFSAILSNRFNLDFEKIFIVPEGGANALGAKGCGEIIKEIELDFDYITLACGTGTTFAGILNDLPLKSKALGFSVLKEASSIHHNIRQLTDKNYTLIEEYHWGGYAKKNEELLRFMEDFKDKTGIKLDYVYTGKMLFGLIDKINIGYFKPQSKIIALHTGGVLNASI